MKIVSKEIKLATLYNRWKKCGPDMMNNKWVPVYNRLKNNPPKTCEEANEIIGNDSWTEIRCSQCHNLKNVVVRVGEEPDFDSATSYICKDCLEKALKMIEKYLAN